MLLFPAIDLKDGKCVRLLRGDMKRATVFNDSPAAQAKAFANAGCEWLHLVDLNGAVEGHPVNRAAVQSILAEVDVPAQLGGGIRTIESIAQWFEAGVQRVILGTVAVKEPGLVKAACRQWPGQVAVGIDAREGMVAVDGWTKQARCARWTWRCASRMPASRHHLHRHRPRAPWAAVNVAHDPRGPAPHHAGDRFGRRELARRPRELRPAGGTASSAPSSAARSTTAG
jgi:imidazole glycerol phosphate synthase subunit HisF